MSHILNKLSGVKAEAIKRQLENDKKQHAEDGMFLEHIWIDADHKDDIYFLFRVNNISKHKELINRLHQKAIEKDPNIQLPHKIFLEDI